MAEKETLRYLIRLIHDLDLISNKQYGLISEQINEVGWMVGGWSESVEEKIRSPAPGFALERNDSVVALDDL